MFSKGTVNFFWKITASKKEERGNQWQIILSYPSKKLKNNDMNDNNNKPL